MGPAPHRFSACYVSPLLPVLSTLACSQRLTVKDVPVADARRWGSATCFSRLSIHVWAWAFPSYRGSRD